MTSSENNQNALYGILLTGFGHSDRDNGLVRCCRGMWHSGSGSRIGNEGPADRMDSGSRCITMREVKSESCCRIRYEVYTYGGVQRESETIVSPHIVSLWLPQEYIS